jgi:alpha-tubulin suppressor-like RCC1 family protein
MIAGVAIILFDNGNLWGWGANSHGALGLGNTTNYSMPKLIATGVSKIFNHSSNNGDNSVFSHARVIFQKTNGKVYGAGRNDFGQLGLGNITAIISSFTELTWIGTNPINVWNLGSHLGHIIAEVDTGSTTNGIKLTRIMASGYNGYGQLGTGNTTQANTAVNVTTAWAGSATTTKRIMAIGHNGGYNTSDGTHSTILMWLRETNTPTATPDQIKTSGSNIRGLLGINNATASFKAQTPQTISVNGNSNLSIKQFSLLSGHLGVAAVLLNDNTLWTWGANDVGQAGVNVAVGANAAVYLPTQAKYQNGLTVSNLSVDTIIYGDAYGGVMSNTVSWTYGAIFIKGTDGNYYASGYGGTGLLGNGENTNSNVFTIMFFPQNITFSIFSSITVEATSALNVTPIWVDSNGDLWVWGDNNALFGNNLEAGNNYSLMAPIRFEWKLPKA